MKELEESEDAQESDNDPELSNNTFSHISSEDLMRGKEIARNEKLRKERQNCKGRPKKYQGQTFASRKKDSNYYYSTNGKLKQSSKEFLNYRCNCSKKYHEIVSVETRETLFKQFGL